MSKRSPMSVWALRDEQLIHIDDTCPDFENGLKCNCQCIEHTCNEPLIARNRATMVSKHFAHNGDSSCSGGVGTNGGIGESVFHKAVKEAIKNLQLCPLPQTDSSKLETILNLNFTDNYLTLQNAKNEESFNSGEFKCDVTGYSGHYRIAIEVVYTSATKSKKISYLNKLGIDVIELELNRLKLPQEEEFIELYSNKDWAGILKIVELTAKAILPEKWLQFLYANEHALRMEEAEAKLKDIKTSYSKLLSTSSALNKKLIQSQKTVKVNIPQIQIINKYPKLNLSTQSKLFGKFYISENEIYEHMFVVNLCFWKKLYFYQYQNIEPNCVFETEEEAKAYEMRNPNTGWISKVNIHLVIYINQIEELRLGQLCLQDYDTNFSKDWNTKINQLENIDKVPRFSSLWRLSSKE